MGTTLRTDGYGCAEAPCRRRTNGVSNVARRRPWLLLARTNQARTVIALQAMSRTRRQQNQASASQPRGAYSAAPTRGARLAPSKQVTLMPKSARVRLSPCSPIKKALDERKGPKNNKRKWGDASFVHAARAFELGAGHGGAPVYSDELLAPESASRQPLRLLATCNLSVHADVAAAHPTIKQLQTQKLALKVWQLEPCGPAAFLPGEVTVGQVQPASVMISGAIVPTIRPLMCAEADMSGGAKSSAGFDLLEKFLADDDLLALCKLRTVETQACQNNSTSTFKREHSEVIVLYTSSSKLGAEYLGDSGENTIIGKKHLRAAFVSVGCAKTAGYMMDM